MYMHMYKYIHRGTILTAGNTHYLYIHQNADCQASRQKQTFFVKQTFPLTSLFPRYCLICST